MGLTDRLCWGLSETIFEHMSVYISNIQKQTPKIENLSLDGQILTLFSEN